MLAAFFLMSLTAIFLVHCIRKKCECPRNADFKENGEYHRDSPTHLIASCTALESSVPVSTRSAMEDNIMSSMTEIDLDTGFWGLLIMFRVRESTGGVAQEPQVPTQQGGLAFPNMDLRSTNNALAMFPPLALRE